VVVPRKVAGQVVGWAVEKSSTERKALAMLREGALLKEIWERYKVL